MRSRMQVLNVDVLRPADRAAAELPRPRQRRHRGRHPARGAGCICKPDRLSVVLVGNAAAFADQLKGVGFGTFETVEIGNLDLAAVDFKTQRQPAAPRRRERGSRCSATFTVHDRALTLRVLLSCGEPSGDLYAGALTRELRRSSPGADVFGLGGPQFAAAGGRAVADYRGLSVTGLTEPIAKIPQFMAARRRPRWRSAAQTRPDVFVPIDFWGFNSRLARASRGTASRSRTTSARSCGRRGRGV